MKKERLSALISLAVCALCSVMLLVLIFTMPSFFAWFYRAFSGHDEYSAQIVKTVVTAFYVCVPFAGAALAMLIALLVNILKEKVFVIVNVSLLRFISWCCYAVMIVTVGFGLHYLPLMVIAIAMGVVGTLLRVVKNIMHSAVSLREENDLTV